MKDTNKHNAILKLYPNVVMIDGDIAYDKDDNIVEYNDLAVTTESLKMTLRAERNRLLAQSDWMANSDVTMTEQWRLYRQALRDITTQTPSLDADGNLTGITWPAPPND